MKTVYVVGAGLAGLACALSAANAGRRVVLFEAAAAAGGRCRSFHDPRLGCMIDNGNHLVLGGNRAVFDFLRDIGGTGLIPAAPEGFPFLDLRDGQGWRLRPNDGALPWWVLAPSRRVPGTVAGDYAPVLRLMLASPSKTVADCLRVSPRALDLLWAPLTLAMLNTPPDQASAGSLGRALGESFAKGGIACRPFVAARGLSDCFIDPALTTLSTLRVEIRLGEAIEDIERTDGLAVALRTSRSRVSLAAGDSVVLAVPPLAARRLLPELSAPQRDAAIVNVAYRLDAPARLPGNASFIGLVGGTAQWVFARGCLAMASVSAADSLIDLPKATIAEAMWRDTAVALGSTASLPAWGVVKERTATFFQTPDQESLRPATATRWRNLFLAGDWTDTRLPATLEGAIRSGRKAAIAVLL